MKIKGKRQRKPAKAAITVLVLGIMAWAFLAFSFVKIDNRIENRKNNPLYSFPSYEKDSIRKLNLSIDSKDWNKIKTKRREALKTGILVVEDEDEVKARLEEGDQSWPVKIRLKGDWVDHLRGLKWSYRVSLRSGQAWDGLVTFSLMTPEARDFLHEFVYHKLLDKFDILNTRYEYVWLNINGVSYGIYALEEHFEKQLVESRRRREGPILKLSEDAMWRMRQREFNANCTFIPSNEIVYAADISAFGLGKILKSPALSDQFEVAQNLMYQYKYLLAPSDEIFDIDRMARYYALADVCRTYHNLIWHNQRFYYNPITSRLEPIGFDGDTGGNFRHLITRRPTLEGGGMLHRLSWKIIGNKHFKTAYKHHLQEMTTPAFMETFFQEVGSGLSHWESLIQKEYPGYTFDRELFRENASNLQAYIQAKIAEDTGGAK